MTALLNYMFNSILKQVICMSLFVFCVWLTFLNSNKIQNKTTEKGHFQKTISNVLINETEFLNYDTIYKYDVVVIGAGISGAVIAERHAKKGDNVLILEKRNHVAGNCYDYIEEDTGIRVSMYGMHLFHTNNADVWNYIKSFSEWRRWDHKVLGFVLEKYVPIPVNINTVNSLFELNISNSDEMDRWLSTVQKQPSHGLAPENSEEMAISRVGVDLYDKIFKPYTQKQWGTHPNLLDSSVTGRIPVRNNFDDRYFSDKFQGLPVNGYTDWVYSMLDHPNITLKLNFDFFNIPENMRNKIKLLYYTGPIDHFFGKENSLEYRSLKFERKKYDNHPGTLLPASVVNFPSLEYPYTRIAEYKHILNQQSNFTVLFKEYPSSVGEPYYPIPTQKNKDKYQELLEQSKKMTNVVFVGRLANYKYFNMDEAIHNAVQTFNFQTRVVHVVITKFTENIDWTYDLCMKLSDIKIVWFVYLKNSKENLDNVKTLVENLVLNGSCKTQTVHVIDQRENVGREGYAWTKYLFSNLVKNGFLHIFLQGRVETKLENVAAFVKQKIVMYNVDMHYEPFHPVICGDEWTRVDFFAKEYDDITVNKLKLHNECYNYRGEFGVTSISVSNFVAKYELFFKEYIIPFINIANDSPMCHVLERLWMPLFKTLAMKYD